MYKTPKLFFVICIIALAFFSCDRDPNKVPSDVKFTEGGVRYKIFHENEKAPQLKVGDMIAYNLVLSLGDSIIQTTSETIKLLEVRKGDFREALLYCHLGDSASIWMSVDTLKKRMVPIGNLPLGSDLKYTFKIKKNLPKAFDNIEEIEDELQEKVEDKLDEEIKDMPIPIQIEQIEAEAVEDSTENKTPDVDSLL